MKVWSSVSIAGLLSLTASCDSLGNKGWDYSKVVDPVTKASKHAAVKSFDVKGSTSSNTSIQATVECEKEGDPSALFVSFLSFDGDPTKQESALELVGDLSFRVNDFPIGPLKKEGSEFSNETKFQLTRLNFVPVFEIFKNNKGDGSSLLDVFTSLASWGGGITPAQTLVLYDQVAQLPKNPFVGKTFEGQFKQLSDMQRTIWSPEFVYSAGTAQGNISITFSLADGVVRKVMDACGFTFGGKPTLKSQTANSAAAAETVNKSNDSASAEAAQPAEDAAQPADEAAQSAEGAAQPADGAATR